MKTTILQLPAAVNSQYVSYPSKRRSVGKRQLTNASRHWALSCHQVCSPNEDGHVRGNSETGLVNSLKRCKCLMHARMLGEVGPHCLYQVQVGAWREAYPYGYRCVELCEAHGGGAVQFPPALEKAISESWASTPRGAGEQLLYFLCGSS